MTAPAVSLVTRGSLAQTGGTIAATILAGSSTGAAALGQANAVGTLSGFIAGNNLSFTDTQPLVAAGTNAAGVGATLTLNDDALSFVPGALLSAPGGVVVLAPATAGDAIALGGTLGTGVVAANTLVVGAATAGALSIAGTLDFSAVPVLSLLSGSGIAEGANGALVVTTLAGSAASVSLGGANTITSLGSFASGGGFTLADTRALSITGPLTAASVTLAAPSITEPGSIAAGTLSASGQSLAFTGSNTIGASG